MSQIALRPQPAAAPAAPGPIVLSARNLRKAYDGRLALRDLSFTLRAGRVLGFLGPNGAGKTTAIRILTTILEPSGGAFEVHGVGAGAPEQIRRKIGVLPESLGFPRQMTGHEYLTYFGRHYGGSAADARANATALLREVALDRRGGTLIGTYSRGMRQRLGIARALVNDPVVVFLDEPTLGLDPRGKEELLALVRRIARERGAGVVLCSHLLAEVEAVCDDVIILNAGQIVAGGTVAEVLAHGRQKISRLRVPLDQAARAAEILATLPFVTPATLPGEATEWLAFEIAPTGNGAPDHSLRNSILTTLIAADIAVLAFEGEGGRLQDVFFELTETGAPAA